MAGRDAPAFCTHRPGAPCLFQKQIVLSQLFPEMDCAHAQHCAAGLPALGVKGERVLLVALWMHGLAVPSGAPAATHEGPRL